MTAIGFTASRKISSDDRQIISSWLNTVSLYSGVSEWITGGCVDGDAFIARSMARLRPKDTHVVIMPANRAQVDRWWENEEFSRLTVHIEYMPPETTYKDRNLRIVEASNGLLGFPMYPENHPKSLRSGTWQTIRLGRKFSVPTQAVVLRSVD